MYDQIEKQHHAYYCQKRIQNLRHRIFFFETVHIQLFIHFGGILPNNQCFKLIILVSRARVNCLMFCNYYFGCVTKRRFD